MGFRTREIIVNDAFSFYFLKIASTLELVMKTTDSSVVFIGGEPTVDN